MALCPLAIVVAGAMRLRAAMDRAWRIAIPLKHCPCLIYRLSKRHAAVAVKSAVEARLSDGPIGIAANEPIIGARQSRAFASRYGNASAIFVIARQQPAVAAHTFRLKAHMGKNIRFHCLIPSRSCGDCQIERFSKAQRAPKRLQLLPAIRAPIDNKAACIAFGLVPLGR